MTVLRKPLAAGFCALALAAPLSAETVAKIIADSGMSPSDFELLDAAAASLYASGTPSVGEIAEWRNDETGATGRVKLESQEGACVELVHAIVLKDKDPVGLRTWRCKDAAGDWLLSLQPPQ